MNNALVEKLKKIIRLADAGTEGERDNAIVKAHQLATEHGIDLAMIRVQADQDQALEKPEEIVKQQVFNGMSIRWKLPESVNYISYILTKFLGTKTVYSGNQVILVGEQSDTVYGQFLFNWLLEEFDRRWKHYRKMELGYQCADMIQSEVTRKFRKPFFYGLYKAIDAKLNDAKQQVVETKVASLDPVIADQVRNQYALMIVDKEERVEGKFKQLYPKLRNCRTSRSFRNDRFSSIAAGRRVGADINLPGRPINDRGRLQ